MLDTALTFDVAALIVSMLAGILAAVTGFGIDGMVDVDAAVCDPSRPTRLLPAYDSGDHLHVNDAGNAAQAGAIPLTLFSRR